jgi:hypothetical protein
MAKVYKNKLQNGETVVFMLVTTSNVMLGDESKLMKDAKDLGITFIHTVAKYRITPDGDVEVKFEIQNATVPILGSPMELFPPVKLQNYVNPFR